MKSISEIEEQKIDNSIKYYNTIRYIEDNGNIVPAKDIYLYGEVDFDNEEDIDNIEKFNLINTLSSHNWMYSNFNFEKGCFTTINGISKGCFTNDALVWFMYNYVLIGKPKRIIVYNHRIKKNK